jgi:CHAT domain-containing protein
MRNKKIPLLLSLIVISFILKTTFSQDKTNYKSNSSISLKDTVLAIEFFEKGKAFSDAAKYDSSNFYYQKVKNIYSELVSNYDKKIFRSGLIQTINNIGWNFILMGEFDTASVVLNQNLVTSIEMLGENNVEVARSYHFIGNLNWFTAHYDDALAGYLKALSIRLKLLGENNIDVGKNYNNLGIVYQQKGDYDLAQENYQKGLSILHKILGSEDPLIARIINNVGNIHYFKGEFELALEKYREALSILQKKLGENHPDVAKGYYNIGIICSEKQEYDKALEYHQKALSIWLNLSGEENPDVAQIYNNIGFAHKGKGEYRKALGIFRKSLSIRLHLFGEKHPDVGISYQNIADTYFRKSEFDSALAYCQKSIISFMNDSNDDSIYSLPELTNINSEPGLLTTLKLKADIILAISDHHNVDNLKTALSTFQLADKLIDKMRTGYIEKGSKLFLGEKSTGIYDQAINTCIKMFDLTKEEKYKNLAFLFAEKGKAVVLQGELAEAEARQFAKLPVHLLEEEKQLKIDLAFYDTQLQNELQKKDTKDGVKISKFESRLFDLKAAYGQLISSIEKNYPAYYDLKYQTKTATVSEIQNQISENTALLQYFVGDSSIYIFSVLKDEYDLAKIKKPENFSGLVKNFYSSILKSEAEKYLTSSYELSSILIEPVLQKIKAKAKLIIIPHDVLYKIPFEALFASTQKQNQNNYSKLDYLIKTFDISYHYSASLYVNGLKNKSELFAEEKSPQKSFIGFAPVFAKNDNTGYTLANSNHFALLSSGTNELLRSVLVDEKRFDELKYSEWEVKAIISLFSGKAKGETGIAYFYSDANEQSFKENAKDYRIVHIASHSFINEEHPEISAVVFAQPTDSLTSDDGILYSGESYNLDLNADLVVLSSCESGLGKLIRGEGMMALTRGFLYSGADNIIFSLWKIPDKQTSELMIEFYNQMLSNKTYAESLRQAKLMLIENELTARPRSWASFVLVGTN